MIELSSFLLENRNDVQENPGAVRCITAGAVRDEPVSLPLARPVKAIPECRIENFRADSTGWIRSAGLCDHDEQRRANSRKSNDSMESMTRSASRSADRS